MRTSRVYGWQRRGLVGVVWAEDRAPAID